MGFDVLSYAIGLQAGKASEGGGSSENDYSDVHFVTFMSEDGSTELYKRPVADGDDCADPVIRGLIEEPEKESTAQYNYTHVGWSASPNGALDGNILKAVTADKTVYANFAAVIRYYTVNFYDGETLLKTESIAYGGSSSYTYEKDNHVFNGWNPAPTNITGDMDCYGEWEESYSFADVSWAYIIEKAESGHPERYFNIGDTKQFSFTWHVDGSIMSQTIDLQIIGFNHDDLADGSGKAGITIATKDALNVYDVTGVGSFHLVNGWNGSDVRTYLNGAFLQDFPSAIRNNIKSVSKTSVTTRSDTTPLVTSDKVFIPSLREYTGENSAYYNWANEGEQYEFYKTANNRKKYQKRAPGKATSVAIGNHTTRSIGTALQAVAYIDRNGAAVTNAADSNYASICFCI